MTVHLIIDPITTAQEAIPCSRSDGSGNPNTPHHRPVASRCWAPSLRAAFSRCRPRGRHDRYPTRHRAPPPSRRRADLDAESHHDGSTRLTIAAGAEERRRDVASLRRCSAGSLVLMREPTSTEKSPPFSDQLVWMRWDMNEARHDRSRCRASLPLLGSDQDSPDPEGPLEPAKFQQVATLYASSCHPMLEFAGQNARSCRALLAQMPGFAELHGPTRPA